MYGDLFIQPFFIPIFHGDGNFYEFAVVFCKVGIKTCQVGQRYIVLHVGFFDAGEYVFDTVESCLCGYGTRWCA